LLDGIGRESVAFDVFVARIGPWFKLLLVAASSNVFEDTQTLVLGTLDWSAVYSFEVMDTHVPVDAAVYVDKLVVREAPMGSASADRNNRNRRFGEYILTLSSPNLCPPSSTSSRA
jgi:hypothetical protein